MSDLLVYVDGSSHSQWLQPTWSRSDMLQEKQDKGLLREIGCAAPIPYGAQGRYSNKSKYQEPAKTGEQLEET